ALTAIASAQTVTDRPVEADVEGPGERANEEPERDETDRRRDGERNGQVVHVDEVVGGNRTRMELPAFEAGADPEEEREVGPEPKGEGLPEAGALTPRLEDGGGDQHG